MLYQQKSFTGRNKGLKTKFTACQKNNKINQWGSSGNKTTTNKRIFIGMVMVARLIQWRMTTKRMGMFHHRSIGIVVRMLEGYTNLKATKGSQRQNNG